MSKLYHLLMRLKGEAEYTFWSWALANYFEARKILPLIVNLKTDKGKCSFSVSRGGDISLREGMSKSPDMTAYSDYSALERIISKKSIQKLHEALREGKIRIKGHTIKGGITIQEIRKVGDK